MVHTGQAASAAAATASSQANLSRPRRLPSSGSFHAGAPFPQLSPYAYEDVAAGQSSAGSRQRRRRSSAAATPSGYGPFRRLSTHNRYHTFPTQPPKTPSEQPNSPPRYPPFLSASSRGPASGDGDEEDNGGSSPEGSLSASSHSSQQQGGDTSTPLPWKQLALLALLSLAEQTALNSIGPYLPTMVASFPSVPAGQVGLYVGLLASSFALAQLATNLFWGYLSDRIGRKPVMLLGTSLLGVCFVFFGFCTEYAHLVGVHVAMGLLNGNAAVVPTCLGEVTDKTNQSRAFTWLPVIYSLGSITGPAVGGLLAGKVGDDGDRHPFLVPNITAAALLGFSVLVVGIWFEETLESDGDQMAAEDGFGNWIRKVWTQLGGCFGKRKERRGSSSWSSRWPTAAHGAGRDQGYSEDDDVSSAEEGADEQQTLLGSSTTDGDNKNNLTPQEKSAFRQLANRTTLAVLVTYLVFQLSNISYNSLYPIFASAPSPTGRDLGPSTIGLSLSLAGLATILFQGFLFQPLKSRVGNLGTYRWSLFGMAISMAMMPWIGYVDEDRPWLGLGTGKGWLYTELGVVLVLKNICAVGGLSSVMLLITNSAPSHETLGTLNGIAQTLSAAGRSVGPFLSGGLFTLSTRVQPKGEALAWGLFAGVSLLGWAGTFLIRPKGARLESADFMGDDDGTDDSGVGGDEEAVSGGDASE
ncbi:major facilitator superfamily domain-containing protein [Apodospora peruviana]|uniref:Major facilitator superfamily domain-containing protein n=1 Tax=Apodospora peruviana TaxID=516989 RepID=A0AAE0IUI7_9PEZI|nr:major facilitator superfamily domain-containing protein [Apodospora peruviana]